MIAFCTSLRARALSNDWAYHAWLLEVTAASMLAQTRGDICVVVGCHDIPDSPLASNPRVRFVPVSVAEPQKTNDAMIGDKVLKLSAGARWAIANGCNYIVFNDADDLVSNRIGAFVDANRGGNGWYNASQRFYTYGGQLMRLQHIAGDAAGPCVIVRSDLLAFARPPFRGAWVDRTVADGEQDYLALLARQNVEVSELAAVGLGHYRAYMAERGTPLSPLPFAGNVVINHQDSMSTAGGVHGYQPISSLGALKRSVRWLPTLRWASSATRREFSIPPNSEIPAAYRGGASVFWR